MSSLHITNTNGYRTKLDRNIVWESTNIKLLSITLDNNPKFDKHVSYICLKANRKLSALTRVAKFLPFKTRCILFIEFQFKYCPSYGCFMEGKLTIR